MDSETETQESSSSHCSTAVLWSNLEPEVRQAIIDSGMIKDVAKAKEPLCIIVPPGKAEHSMFPVDLLNALGSAYEIERFIYDVPDFHWKVRMYCDRVQSSL